tara:strand:- start:296 stop:766 length:471 start_codon:yes stop_codon:yes gene_type:complete
MKIKMSRDRVKQIIQEEYDKLRELEDPRSPSPMSYESPGAADDFRTQVMNLVLKLAPLTLDPKKANAVEIEIRDVLNTLGIGTDPRSRMRQEEALKGKQKELDVDDDGKIEAEDFAKLRKGLRDKDVGEDAEDEDDKKKTENLKRMVREEILAALR